MMTPPGKEPGEDLRERLSVAMGLVTLNQGLIQFADSKANRLIVVNSIFIASAGLDAAWAAGSAPGRLVLGAFFLASVAALMLSLRVLTSRAAGRGTGRSLLYYRDVSAFNLADNFAAEFRSTEPQSLLDSILLANYDLAGIAAAKFDVYAWAERMTMAAAALWIAVLTLRLA